MSNQDDTMLSRSTTQKTEVRVEFDPLDLAVVDGVCNGTGRSRTEVLREWLADRSKIELHKATVICRVAGVNPMRSDTGRTV